MIEDDFYCTVKFKSGEEIFAKVAASEEEDRTILLVSNPIIVQELKSKMGVVGYKVEPWLKTTKDDLFVITMDKVLTMSETDDIDMIMMYQRYLRDSENDSNSSTKISKKMGYVANVKDAKIILEKIFKNTNNTNS